MASLGSLVIELAANTARLQGDLGRGINMLQGFASKAKSVVGVLGVGAAGGFFGSLVRDAISLGDELQKGAQRAGIAAGTFSQLAAAAKQTDVDIGTLSKGLKNMQVAISTAAQGGKEAQSAFRQLGLNLDTLKDATADEALKRIADALKAVPNPNERARLGAAALGKAYQDLVPLLDQGRQGINALVEEQKRLGNTFSDQQIQKLADTDDSIKKLKASFSGLATAIAAEAAPALTHFFDSLSAGISGDRVRLLKAQIDTLQSQLNFATGDPRGPTITPEEIARRKAELADLRRQLRAASPPTRTHSRGLNFSAEIAAQRQQDEATRDQREKDAKELTKLNEDLQKGYRDSLTSTNEIINTQTNDLIEQQANYLGGYKQVFDQHMEEIERGSQEHFNQLSVYADEAARNIQGSLAQFFFDPTKDGLRGLAKNFSDTFRQIIANVLALKAQLKLFGELDSKGNFSGGLFSGFLNGLFGGFGGARASGGPVSPGRSYLVGERGREMFVPKTPGYIVPNAGGVTIAPVYQLSVAADVSDRALVPVLQRWGKETSDLTINRVRALVGNGRL